MRKTGKGINEYVRIRENKYRTLVGCRTGPKKHKGPNLKGSGHNGKEAVNQTLSP
jgi:hypothetical protein